MRAMTACAILLGAALLTCGCSSSPGHSGNPDDAAYEAAMRLGKAGNLDAATQVAKTITTSTRRDQALSKIAQGDFAG